MLQTILSSFINRHPHRKSRSNRQSRFVFEPLEARRLLAVTVPEFSSLPGADHTIYLDFDGQVVEDTSWNSFYGQATLEAPVYNIDGDATSFNSTELIRIEEAWNRIAEDFQPFNVNVTTVAPGVEALRKNGTSDLQWGVRVIMTNEANMVTDLAQRTNAGGIAYIDSFNWTTDTPVWVFTTGGKSIAEAASHEVGHSLGLSHDGLISGSPYYEGHGGGETGWASIMGVGYYQNVSQWDSGEYYNSNNGSANANYGNGPDDLVVIVGNNGFGYRVDDHGDSDAASSILGLDGTTVVDSGLIETRSDVDVFSFATGAGLVTLNLDPSTPGPNLDIKAELFDSLGGLVATSNSTSVLDAGFALNLPAGQYFVHVEGTGWGTPGASSPSGYSDYGSLGQYTVSGSIVDDGGLPTISINNVSDAENGGPLTFELSLSEPSDGSISVTYQTADGTAIEGSDYVAAVDTLTFLEGQQTRILTIDLINDAVFENTENMFVNLSSASGAMIIDGQGIGTIFDDDPAPLPMVSISDASVNEGKQFTRGRNRGTNQLTDIQFAVTLSEASSQTVTIGYATGDGTATSDNFDYQVATGIVTFNPGETSKTITVTVLGDNIQEPDETFSVNLVSPNNAIILDGMGTGTIVDDDAGGGGNGNGGKKNKKSSSELNPVAIEDAMWFFEGIEETNDLTNDIHQRSYGLGNFEHLSPVVGPMYTEVINRNDATHASHDWMEKNLTTMPGRLESNFQPFEPQTYSTNAGELIFEFQSVETKRNSNDLLISSRDQFFGQLENFDLNELKI